MKNYITALCKMGRIKRIMIVAPFYLFFSIGTLYASGDPLCTKSEKWEYIINNAYRVADESAMNKYPRATFIRERKEKFFNFCKQNDGDFKGKYLLLITNKRKEGTSVTILSPLFDVNKSSEGLDDEDPFWKVVRAEFNGRLYGGSYKAKFSCVQVNTNDPTIKQYNESKKNITIITSGFLDVDTHYKLSIVSRFKVILWQENNNNPSSVRNIPDGSIIYVKGRDNKGLSTVYEVEVKLPDGAVVSGWITITALVGQKLEEVK